ncbi:hypothetical protein [uncultured Sphingomonas sp.]|uniref:hypothetical protein n=1 Tax=uncultured Sphingomonas sp. TaxID=158754 RepID=UPI00260F00A4|nr:hypothetical protein [uncultured Sphingomonas sp.]
MITLSLWCAVKSNGMCSNRANFLKANRSRPAAFWWIAEWLLSEGDREKADARSGGGAGGSNACRWWIADRPLSISLLASWPSVQLMFYGNVTS